MAVNHNEVKLSGNQHLWDSAETALKYEIRVTYPSRGAYLVPNSGGHGVFCFSYRSMHCLYGLYGDAGGVGQSARPWAKVRTRSLKGGIWMEACVGGYLGVKAFS